VSPLVRTPDVVELRSFCVAADLGSLGRAAMRLHVSQPALSKRLQSLEALAGVRLLDRSPRGVTLTPAGRTLYEQARRLLEQADAIEALLEGLQRDAGPIVLAASHSAAEAFVAGVLAGLAARRAPVELITANSPVVRTLVAEGRAALGVAAARPGGTPNPGVREIPIGDDEILYAVPREHRWARRQRVAVDEFLREPVVVRDPTSNARRTVEAQLGRHGLAMPPLLVQAATPGAAKREALARGAPVLLSRGVLAGEPFVPVSVGDLRFPRRWEAVLPAIGEPSAETAELIELLRAAAGA
jgi:DNA-binding transcriptional LysR family regulator